MKRVILFYGRFNPPTKAHENIFYYVTDAATKEDADHFIFISHSENDDNKLEKEYKYEILKKTYPRFNFVLTGENGIKNITDIYKYLAERYDVIRHVVGSDRVEDFKPIARELRKTTGVVVSFRAIPRSEKSLSSSKLKELASRGMEIKFKKLLPTQFSEEIKNEIYEKIK